MAMRTVQALEGQAGMGANPLPQPWLLRKRLARHRHRIRNTLIQRDPIQKDCLPLHQLMQEVTQSNFLLAKLSSL